MRYILSLFTLLAASCGTPQSRKLIIYSAVNPDTAEYYKQAFTKETGIEVEFIFGSTGEIIKRIEVEKNSPTADMQWGGSEEYAERIKDALEPYHSSNEEAFIEAYKNNGGFFTSVTVLPNVLLINTNLYQKPITGYMGLLDPALRGKIAFADPSLSSSSFEHLVNMLYAMGDGDPEKGWPFVEKFIAQLEGKLLASSSILYRGVGSGEYAVGLTVEFGAISQIRSGSPVRIVYMEEGLIAKNYGLFLVKGAKHSANAKKFIDFMTSKKMQDSFSRFDSRGVRKDFEATEGEPLPSLTALKLISPDKELVLKRKDAWLNMFKDIYAKNTIK